MRSGSPGHGYSKPVTFLFPVNNSDTGTLQYHSTPYFLSLQVLMAEPVGTEVKGMELCGKLYKGSDCQGPIDATIVAVSEDGLRLIVQSDYIIPIDERDYNEETIPQTVYDRWTASQDPNDPAVQIYAPLWPDDPNLVDENGVLFGGVDPNRYVSVHCVPISDGENLTIEFNSDMAVRLVEYVAEYWLSENKNLDTNNDGVVNLKDWSVFTN
jgi:hypothetical protein